MKIYAFVLVNLLTLSQATIGAELLPLVAEEEVKIQSFYVKNANAFQWLRVLPGRVESFEFEILSVSGKRKYREIVS